MEAFLSMNAALAIVTLLKEKALAKGVDSALKKLFHREESELRLSIQRVDEKISRIERGPMEAGLFWLERASQPVPSSADRSRFLHRAVVRFVDAHAQLAGSDKARAVLLAALTFEALGDSGQSKYCMEVARRVLDEVLDSTLIALRSRMIRTTKLVLPFVRAFDDVQQLFPTLNDLISRDSIDWTMVKTSRVDADAYAGILKRLYWLTMYRNGERRGEIDISEASLDDSYLAGLPEWIYEMPFSELS